MLQRLVWYHKKKLGVHAMQGLVYMDADIAAELIQEGFAVDGKSDCANWPPILAYDLAEPKRYKRRDLRAQG